MHSHTQIGRDMLLIEKNNDEHYVIVDVHATFLCLLIVLLNQCFNFSMLKASSDAQKRKHIDHTKEIFKENI